MDRERFQKACELVIGKERERAGIGTYGEKTLHAVLKHYLEPDASCHEVKTGGFVADIYRESGIIEIQTRSFNTLRRKLAAFLEVSTVTVAYPVARTKWLTWLDRETGEVTKKRKSPKTGSPCEAFYELYKIKQLLTHPNLRLLILMLDIEETRNLDGWSEDKKKGSSRYERIPVDIIEEICINSIADYIKLIPHNLPGEFTTKDFRKASGLSLSTAQTALNVLYSVGAVTRVGKSGNTYLYNIDRTLRATETTINS